MVSNSEGNFRFNLTSRRNCEKQAFCILRIAGRMSDKTRCKRSPLMRVGLHYENVDCLVDYWVYRSTTRPTNCLLYKIVSWS